jgi:hypothetical protein
LAEGRQGYQTFTNQRGPAASNTTPKPSKQIF